ncbi:LysR family transcriptional regulator [Kordiimonas marina]|uniref:LysR family transcriptional regulator n=1 Tax=Kordiimonas marina TaxID=2872312 RepID=UPI001FF45FE7|nr:LysR family transcriptional regulator [Kordiimonas marina]MCJ9430476.1 LysR family transcriptional regulator [Kordiimonas marina]
MRKGIDFRDIALLVRLAETGNLTAAARALDLPPAVASRRLAALEHALSLKLAERTSRSTRVTPEGEALANTARQMLKDWDATLGQFHRDEGALTGTVRVSAPHMFGRSVLAPALSAFTSRYPLIRLVFQFSDQPLDLYAEGLDLVVRIAQPSGKEGVVRKLAGNHKVVVASPDYLDARSIPSVPAELRDHDCLVPAGRADWCFEAGGARETITVSGPIEVNDGAFIRDAAVHGAGLALKSWFDVADLVREGALVTVLDGYSAAPDQAIWAILRADRAEAPEVQAFLAFLEEAAGYGSAV